MLQIVRLIKGGGMVHPKLHPAGLQAHNVAHLFDNLPSFLEALGDDRTNIFWVIGHHNGLGGKLPSRDAGSFDYQTVVPFDIDHGTPSRAFEYLDAVAHVIGIARDNLLMIGSGNGVQIFVNLKTPIRSAKFFTEMKPAYNEVCFKIDAELKKRGLPGDADRRVFDAARVMRFPGTINSKPNIPDTETSLLQKSYTPCDFDLMVVSGLDKLKAENISPEQVRRQYPTPDFPEVSKECRFVRWAMEHPDEVHEPHLFDLISLFATMPPGAKISYQSKEMSAFEVAEYIFNHASSSRSLARGNFQEKWDAASRYGARKCSTIAQNWSDECKSCPWKAKIPTPLALKSEAHVGSEEMGYWVMNSKGGFSEPNYADVVKVFTSEASPVVRSNGFLSVFDGAIYQEEVDLRVESWLEKKMTPRDPVRDRHCKEFVKKVKRAVVLSAASEEEFFERSLVGKLNCKNGVLDIMQGVLLPHSPQYGFQSVLPYDYLPDESSELFLDWLATITENRPELMESLLDVMAYVLWPTYDDHMFTFLIGEGANGKSTLLHIMAAMIGKDSYSAASIQQLGTNRFAPAQLSGKMANFSEESSGYRMNLEDMNMILNLSAGGEIVAERKGVQGFAFKNKAKLIFSANKTPQFANKGDALTRRMLAIPFDHHITTPDSRVEDNLIAEVPKIISMLVRRIQSNIKENGGKFKVFRGGQAAADTQLKVLLSGDNVYEWATESIESHADFDAEGQYIISSDAYSHYKKWCAENGYDYVSNHKSFSSTLYRFSIHPSVDRHKNIIKVNGKACRVFKKTKWKETI